MTLSTRVPNVGDVVRVRTRTWVVDDVDPHGAMHRVHLSCLDDDAQGDHLEVVWQVELDTGIVTDEVWRDIGTRGFDQPRHFASYLHALRWNCITATRSDLFQSPFRAGIRIEAWQLEPLQKALHLPRVNLFIADDVGLGKTIEAGLIASELLLRRRIHDIVVAAPPSMLQQWRDELDTRFGLTFEILDRAYIEKVRRERGYGVNPWTTFPRFLISQRLLIDETYVAPMRDWLDNLRPGSLLILDEAHHAAPSSGVRYAIDSRITRAVRDLAPRFEHRIFLSATPHNGHSNSFSALLEILDGQRFCRGVPVTPDQLAPVMIRRLKDDLRELVGGFPRRVVRQIDVEGLEEDAPELVLPRLLDEYAHIRNRRVRRATRRKQAEAALLISSLQQRLLSSIEAFARTLEVHARTMERIWERDTTALRETPVDDSILFGSPDADDDRATLEEEELALLADGAVEAATGNTAGDEAEADPDAERALIARMREVAAAHRGAPDARLRRLIAWIREHQCPEGRWNDRRVIIFTEYEDTRRHLVQQLAAALAETDRADERIMVFHGPTSAQRREQIKRAFNAPPEEHPVRILVATDAAREGLNLQAHCRDLFHFDVPWNPARLEQRNGRIDRKLQPAAEVTCHYFVYTQRPEDRVLQALVRKTDTIRRQLGSLGDVLDARLAETLRGGITRAKVDHLMRDIENLRADDERLRAVDAELESARERRDALAAQTARLEKSLATSRTAIAFDTASFRDALSCSLELQGAAPLARTNGAERFRMAPTLLGDPTWAATLDTLRTPADAPTPLFEWRRDAPLREVVFDAPPGIDDSVVHLHLQHRVARRLLGRFHAQGFVHHDLSRACLATSGDTERRVVLLGRLSVYGPRASRLHEEILTITARWSDARTRTAPLEPYARATEQKTLALLEESLRPGAQHDADAASRARFHEGMTRDIDELLPHLQARGAAALADARRALTARGASEAEAMREILTQQRKRILRHLEHATQTELALFDREDERRQFEANRRAWQAWIENVDGDLEREPARILDFYTVASHRIEPVGIVYLAPERSRR